MSRYVAALVYRKRIGSMARKAVLAYCAERANDDGSGVWPAKTTIAKEVECSKKTVIEVMRDMVNEGLLIERGKRKTGNGFVVVYDLNLEAIAALPDAISEEELTGVILNPSPDVTPRGEVSSPQEVTSLHPNRPLTVLKPSNARKGANDLFSENPEPEKPDRTSDEIEDGFKEFWDEIWPSHKRKTGRADCRKVYEQACRGKHPKAEQVSPADLNAAACRYIASVKDREYLKGPLPWLRLPGWEPFLGKRDPQKPLSYAQRVLMEYGQ